jgi:hypothetical protein
MLETFQTASNTTVVILESMIKPPLIMIDLSQALMTLTPLYPSTNKHRRWAPFKEVNKQLSDLLHAHLDNPLRFFLKASIEEESLAGNS